MPYLLPRRVGKAAMEITVVSGKEVELDYVAPATSFARGKLTTRGGPRPARTFGVHHVL